MSVSSDEDEDDTLTLFVVKDPTSHHDCIRLSLAQTVVNAIVSPFHNSILS